jgi:hypothetical protein
LEGPKAEQAEGGVGQAVFRRWLGEHLRGDAARGEVDEVVTLEGGFAGGSVVFAESVGHVAGLVGTDCSPGAGRRVPSGWMESML